MASVELLSPAGNRDCMKAAIDEGADAVYFGLESFNARKRADNFTLPDLGEIAGYCHDRGVKAYLAANTLVKNTETGEYFNMIEKAYEAGIDAVIIQELSFAGIIKENFTGMQVHISTQAGIFNSYCKKLISGADRVILPREMTLSQVRDFINKTKIDVEIFVQGALCFSIGGQCLMSGLPGRRSGNRGRCAQPCRKKYNGKFLLSTRDLCVIDNLDEIIKSGARGLKIEGRLRSPGYVGAATALYRRAIDTGCVDSDALFDLKLEFSREYTRGGLFKEYDVVACDASGKRGIYLGKMESGGVVRLKSNTWVGDGVGIYTHTRQGVHGDMIKNIIYKGKEVKCGFSGQRVKLTVNAHENDDLVLTSGVKRRKPYVKSINRREKITVRRDPKKAVLPKVERRGFEKSKLLVKAYSACDAAASLEAGASKVYYNIFEKDYPAGVVNPYIPRCLLEWSAEKAINMVEQINPASVLCGDPAVAAEIKMRNNECEIYLDISCNAFNDFDVALYQSLGMTPVISPELSFVELGKFKDKRFAVYVHGRIPLMTTRYKIDADILTDEKRYSFPVRCEFDYKQVLNSVPLGLYSYITKLYKMGIKEYLVDLSNQKESAYEIVSAYKGIINGEKIKKPRGYTLGNYREGVI